MSAEQLTAVAAMISALAWPAVVLVLILSQRRAVSGFLGNVESFKASASGIETTLRKAVDEAATRALRQDSDAGKHPSPSQVDAAFKIGEMSQQIDPALVGSEIRAMAREYEHIRAAMPSGDPRTRRMEIVVTRMRTLAVAALPLLEDLKASPSAGERLAAVAILQVVPSARQLGWLAARLGQEKPFVGYHAAVALLAAARLLDPEDLDEVRAALIAALDALGPRLQETDRAKVLQDALRVVDERQLAPNGNTHDVSASMVPVQVGSQSPVHTPQGQPIGKG